MKRFTKIGIIFCQRVENLSKRKGCERWEIRRIWKYRKNNQKALYVLEQMSSWTFQMGGDLGSKHSEREVENDW